MASVRQILPKFENRSLPFLRGGGASGDVKLSIVPLATDVNVGLGNVGSRWIRCDEWKKATEPAPTTAITATLFAAEQYSSCPQPAMELTYDWTTMNALVDSMTPSGSTNQGIGLAVGWMSLVGGSLFFAPAKDLYYLYKDVVILLTDGMNTQNRWYSSQSAIDAREQMTCDNAGVILYTNQVNTGGDPTSTLLQNCASGSDKFFLLMNADQMVTTFNTIGTNLSKLRLPK